MTLSKKNTLIIKEQKKNKNNKMGSLDKRKIITQIIIFNILWFICGVLVLEYLFYNTDIINKKYKSNILIIGMVITFITVSFNVIVLLLLKEIQNKIKLLSKIRNNNLDSLYGLDEKENKNKRLYQWEYNYSTQTFLVNDNIIDYLGMEKINEISVKVFIDKIHEQDKDRIRKELKEIEIKKRVHLIFRLKDKVGRNKWFFSDTKLIVENNGSPIKMMGVLHDFVEICEKEDELNNLSNFLDNSINEIQLINPEDLRLLKVNKQSQLNLGFNEYELNHKKITDLISDNYSEKTIKDLLSKTIETKEKTINLKSFYKRKDNTIYPVEIYFFLSKYQKNKVIAAIIIDATQKDKNEEFMQYLFQHDNLTGVGNRLLLNENLLKISKEYKKSGQQYAVLYIDLDRFKLINDTFGHLIGDEFIKLFSQKIKNELNNKQTLYRISGDEFIIVYEEMENKKEIEKLAAKLINSFKKKTIYKENEIHVGASVGIAIFPEDGKTYEDLIVNADIAVMEAKSLGGEQYMFFNQTLTKLTKTKLKIEIELKEAINNNRDIITYLQPQINIKGRKAKVIGAEVLVRWNHPDKGLVNPTEFISIAEETNLIVKLGDKILRDAAIERVRLLNMGYKDISFAVNISGKQLQGFEDVERIISIVESVGCPKELIKLELTESMMMHPTKELLESLKKLKEEGFKLALDDFGTGYSSFSYLKKLPLDYLKIDASFIRDLQNSKNDLFILKSIINLAHGLNLISIAEGVEKEEELKVLKFLGCDIIQGYYFSKPLDPPTFEKYLKNFN